MALGNNKKKAGNDGEASSKTVPSETGTPNSLKPGPKIVKKIIVKKIKVRKLKDSPQVQEKGKDENQTKNGGNKGKSVCNQINEDKKLKGETKKNSTEDGDKEKRTNNKKNEEKKPNSQKGIKEKITANEKSENEEKKPNLKKGNKEKSMANKKCQRDQDKTMLGGLIFMCNAKTKPDCFRYGVMGVSLNNKEVVLAIKPGLKLFLYDFDLRLMYGIYKASSAGGMKLERSAFAGAFPAQVRFKVHEDCLPLPESVFKNAIKENYKGNDKFKTELTVQQVKKLTELFQPVQHQLNAHSFIQAPSAPFLYPLPMPVLVAGENLKDRREALTQVHREALPRDAYSLDESRRHYIPSDHERDQRLHRPTSTHREMAPKQTEAASREPLFLSEKEYRTYGLRQARRTSPPTATAPTPPSFDPYAKDPYYRPSVLSNPYPQSRGKEAISSELNPPVSRRETYLTDSRYAERGATDYSRTDGKRGTTDYWCTNAERGASDYSRTNAKRGSTDYWRTNAESGATDHSRTMRVDDTAGLYSTYASNALSDYNQKQYVRGRAELSSVPVSSRYSFAGPSLSYN